MLPPLSPVSPPPSQAPTHLQVLRQERVLGVLVHAALKGDVALLPGHAVRELDVRLVSGADVYRLAGVCRGGEGEGRRGRQQQPERFN